LKANPTASIVLPFYNEEGSVQQVMRDLLESCRKAEDWQIELV